MKPLLLALLWAMLGSAAPARAHKPSDSYLTLAAAPAGARGHWDLALRDLDRALRLDADGDGALTWGELRAREAEVVRHALAQLSLSRGQRPCLLSASALTTVAHTDGGYARIPLQAACAAAGATLDVQYDFFFALDASHRAVLTFASPGAAGAAQPVRVLRADARTTHLPLDRSDALHAALALLGAGVEHILSGLDHVLFLLALLLPSVLPSRPRGAFPAPGRVLRQVAAVVTAFTVAHSITLVLAALGVVEVSARVVEPAIALSVTLAAADNLWPRLGAGKASVAFALGLLHGLGFASALVDLGREGGAFLTDLALFNAGVELGQLAIVLAFVPLALLLRHRRAYRTLVVQGGSLAIIALSLLWLLERVRV